MAKYDGQLNLSQQKTDDIPISANTTLSKSFKVGWISVNIQFTIGLLPRLI